MTIVAPLNAASLLGEDASELYAKNVYNLHALMVKENVIVLNWDDEVLAKTVLTHAGKHRRDASTQDAFPSSDHKDKAAPPVTRAA